MRDSQPQSAERAIAPFSPSIALAVFDTIGIPILVLDPNLRVVEANRAFCDAFRLQRSRIQGERVTELGDRWSVPALGSVLDDFMLGRRTVTACELGGEVAGIGPRVMLFDARITAGIRSGAEPCILLTVNDVTAERGAAARRDDDLRRKEILLEEMSHRVSNSLTIITALLQYKAKVVESYETRAILNEIQQRIVAIGSVQRLLQVPENGRTVALAPLLNALCDNLSQGATGRGQRIGVSVQAGGAVVDSAAAVNIGLIVTELVINALRHGFPAGRDDGHIAVAYEAMDEDWTLSVSDNGIGARRSGPPSLRKGLGTFIVGALAKQLNAQLDVVVTAGTGRTTTLTHGVAHDVVLPAPAALAS